MSLAVRNQITPFLNGLIRECEDARRQQQRKQDEEERQRESERQMVAAVFYKMPLFELLEELRQRKPGFFMIPPQKICYLKMKVEAAVYADELLLLLFTSGRVFAYPHVPCTVFYELTKSADPYQYYRSYIFARRLGWRVR